LRRAFWSLLIYEGQTAVEVAAQLGNSPVLVWDAYAHVIAEAKGGERMSAEAAIKAAREHDVSEKCPPEAAPAVSGEADRVQPSLPPLGRRVRHYARNPTGFPVAR
jgi:hypothetical protein